MTINSQALEEEKKKTKEKERKIQELVLRTKELAFQITKLKEDHKLEIEKIQKDHKMHHANIKIVNLFNKDR